MGWRTAVAASLVAVAWWLAGIAGASPASGPASEPPRKVVEDYLAAAQALSFFPGEDFVHDRVTAYLLNPAEVEGYRKIMDLLLAAHETADILPLLKHDDAKVRTLAIAAVFARDDAKLLPHLLPLANDAAQTFPRPRRIASIEAIGRPRLEPQTVGEVACQAIAAYCPGFRGHVQAFERDYWPARRDRAFCAGWFAAHLDRAAQGMAPAPPARQARVRAVRQRIDQLNREDRAWTLLWLGSKLDQPDFASEQDLVEACRSLGQSALMLMLDDKPPSADPDLQIRIGERYWNMIRFVLRHAKDLLAEEHADALMRCRRTWETPLYAIAASELKPAQAARWIPQALEKLGAPHRAWDRAELMAALWRLDEKSAPAVVEWFHGEPVLAHQAPHARARFIGLVSPQAATRRLVATLAADKRFDELDWQTLRALSLAANAAADKPVVDPLDLAIDHPVGLGRFHVERERAAREYPAETRELYKAMAVWRSDLRAAGARWAKGQP